MLRVDIGGRLRQSEATGIHKVDVVGDANGHVGVLFHQDCYRFHARRPESDGAKKTMLFREYAVNDTSPLRPLGGQASE